MKPPESIQYFFLNSSIWHFPPTITLSQILFTIWSLSIGFSENIPNLPNLSIRSDRWAPIWCTLGVTRRWHLRQKTSNNRQRILKLSFYILSWIKTLFIWAQTESRIEANIFNYTNIESAAFIVLESTLLWIKTLRSSQICVKCLDNCRHMSPIRLMLVCECL